MTAVSLRGIGRSGVLHLLGGGSFPKNTVQITLPRPGCPAPAHRKAQDRSVCKVLDLCPAPNERRLPQGMYPHSAKNRTRI
jgi:hypothetical protein